MDTTNGSPIKIDGIHSYPTITCRSNALTVTLPFTEPNLTSILVYVSTWNTVKRYPKMIYVVLLIIGAIIGWVAHKAYLRGIAKAIRRMRRKLVGR